MRFIKFKVITVIAIALSTTYSCEKIFGDLDEIPYRSYIEYNDEYFQLSDSLQYDCFTTANVGPLTIIVIPSLSEDTTSAGIVLILGESIHHYGDSLKEEFYNTPINIFQNDYWK